MSTAARNTSTATPTAGDMLGVQAPDGRLRRTDSLPRAIEEAELPEDTPG